MVSRCPKVVIEFELEEAIALNRLYEVAPDDLDLHIDNVWFGDWCDRGALRLTEAIASLLGFKEILLEAGSIRAELDQIDAADV